MAWLALWMFLVWITPVLLHEHLVSVWWCATKLPWLVAPCPPFPACCLPLRTVSVALVLVGFGWERRYGETGGTKMRVSLGPYFATSSLLGCRWQWAVVYSFSKGPAPGSPLCPWAWGRGVATARRSGRLSGSCPHLGNSPSSTLSITRFEVSHVSSRDPEGHN